MREECNATAPRKKHAGIVAGKPAGSASMEKLFRFPRRKLEIERFNVTAPNKKRAKLAEEAEEEKSGAASMDKSCSQPKPNVEREAVKLIALKRKHADGAVAGKAAESAGRVLTAESFK